MSAVNIDQSKFESFLSRAFGDLSPAYGGAMVSLGTKLGLYKAMAGAGPLSSAELAARTGCAERYVREWLNSQVAGGYVDYHAVSGTYELTAEQALVLADEDSPAYLPNAWNVVASLWFDEHKAIEAFRTGKGIPWGERDSRLACGSAAFVRNAYRGNLVSSWLPALASSIACTIWAIPFPQPGMPRGPWPPTARSCWWSRSPTTGSRTTSRRLPGSTTPLRLRSVARIRFRKAASSSWALRPERHASRTCSARPASRTSGGRSRRPST